jgi:hypothetical protein
MSRWDVDVAGVGGVIASTALDMVDLTGAGAALATAAEALYGSLTGTVQSALATVLDARAHTVERISIFADLVVDSVRTAVAQYVAADVSMADDLKRAAESAAPSADAPFVAIPGHGKWGAV